MILAGVFVVATGRGGELAYEQADHAPLDLGPVSATDVALLRPPTALWGYNMQVTDEALDRIARALRDRDIEIAYLQRQLADLGQPQPTLARLDQPSLTRLDQPALTRLDQPALAGLDQPELTDEDTTQPKRFVPRHERPRPGSTPDPGLASVASDPRHAIDEASEEQAAGQAREGLARADQAPGTAQSRPAKAEAEDESDSVAAAEEQGW